MIRYELDWKNAPEEELEVELTATTRLRFWRVELLSLKDDFSIAAYAFWGKLKVWPFKKKKPKAAKPEDEDKAKKRKKRKPFRLPEYDPSVKRALTHIIKQFVWLIGRSLPKELRGELDFSLGDPANTGMTLGLISLCPAAYGKRVSISPDFTSEEVYAYGQLHLKGIVFYRHIGYLIFKVVSNEDCQKLFARLKR